IRGGRMPENLAANEVSAIVMAGFAGALDPALKIGEVMIDAASDLSIEMFRRVRMHCAGQIISSPRERAGLFERSRASVVEMENDAVREFARRQKIPYI